METVETFTALHRFGLGPRPGEAAGLRGDARAWLAAQTSRPPAASQAMAGAPGSAALLGQIFSARRAPPERRDETLRRRLREGFAEAVLERTRHLVTTSAPFAERMLLFWSNHFTVSTTRGLIGPAIPAYEREAIRPHVFGRFADMLLAVVRHPVMLTYLDNVGSMGTNSAAGRRRGSRQGTSSTLNENLAREILELHTLGVNGGYGQQDVIELANAISGWTHGATRSRRDARPVHGGFEFRPEYHEPGTRTILGRRYPEGGTDQGEAVLADLARHPSTATFLAHKLVRHLVADDPPGDAVARNAKVFRDTDGDLGEVSRALVALEAAWRDPMTKAKSHHELVVATHRACCDGLPLRAGDVLRPLRELGQMPFAAPSPQGWGDRTADWISPEALMRRVQWLRQHAARLPATVYPQTLLDDLIGPVARETTRTWVARAPSGDAAIAVILASPEFQRR